MNKTKKPKNSQKKVYIVIQDDYIIAEPSFEKAKATAEWLYVEGSDDIRVYEVTKAWYIYIPEEPEPEMLERKLEDVLEE